MRGRIGGMADLLLAHESPTYWPLVFAALALAIPVVLMALVIAPMVAKQSRFSLRTLLIVTTLVAVVLGLVVYATL
jgi:hypothetical protein